VRQPLIAGLHDGAATVLTTNDGAYGQLAMRVISCASSESDPEAGMAGMAGMAGLGGAGQACIWERCVCAGVYLSWRRWAGAAVCFCWLPWTVSQATATAARDWQTASLHVRSTATAPKGGTHVERHGAGGIFVRCTSTAAVLAAGMAWCLPGPTRACTCCFEQITTAS